MMDVIFLCMKKSGIRFFNKIKFSKIKCIKLHLKHPFLCILKRRKSEYDIVLIMAHGASGCILTTSRDLHQRYVTYIDKSETTDFINDFVFAVSCDTANEFGKESIKNGAIAYLGYQIKIAKLFCTKGPNIPSRISSAFDTIIKHIFIEEISANIEAFVTEITTVKLLRDKLSFDIERRLYNLQEMNSQQIHELYGVKIDDKQLKKYMGPIMVKQLEFVDEVNRHFVCLGDGNYFYHGFITECLNRGQDRTSILERMCANEAYSSIDNVSYKEYLKNKIISS